MFKKIILLFLMSATNHLYAGPMDWMKGCLIFGGTTIGGVAMAASQSDVKFTDTQAYILAGATGCLIGGFISGDLVRKAEMAASEELKIKNQELTNDIYLLQHDICFRLGRCGPDGKPFKGGKSGYSPDGLDAAESNYRPLDSGN